MTDIELCMRSKWCRDEAIAEAAARWAEKKAEPKKESEPVRESEKKDAEKLMREVIKPQRERLEHFNKKWI